MKKALLFITIILIAVVFVSCDFLSATTTVTTAQETTLETSGETTFQEVTTGDVSNYRYQKINFYSINDFHGGTYSDIANLEEMGAFLKAENANSENTVILSNGDIFQGAALSNYYYGRPIVDIFNNIGFDGFVIGNHEFDWGIDKVMEYSDGSTENGEMEYPILAANIVYQDSQEMIENTVPYIIKEMSGVKVGIIGLIGDVINSISASRVENIEFLDPADTIYQYAEELRVDEACDIIVVYIHNGSDIDDEIADFTGDHFVDAIFNGHTHQSETASVSRSSGGLPLYYAQAANRESSLFVGISLEYDKELDEVTKGTVTNYEYDTIDFLSDSEIFSILNDYMTDTIYTDFVSEELTVSSGYYDRYDLVEWGATVLRDYVGIDAGALNSGGFRNSIYSGSLTMGDMIEIYPFDNYIKTSEMTGAEFTSLYNDLLSDDVYWDEGVYYSGSTLYINGSPIVNDRIYVIGAVDYVFDKTYYGFLDGDNVTLTTYLMRDLIVEDLRNTVGNFDPSNGTSYRELFTVYDPNYYRKLELSLR